MKRILFLILIASFSSCNSQNLKLPKTIKIDTIKQDYDEYLISYNFEYNNKHQLVKIIDSTKKRKKILIQELSLIYNKNNGKLKSYTYKKSTEVTHHEIVYEDNKILMFPSKDSNTEYTITLDNSKNGIEIKKTNKENNYFNSITKPIYYQNGNLKQLNNTIFEYNNSKGIFSDVNMEPWFRIYFSSLIQQLNFSKNLLIKQSKGEKYKTNFKYEVQNKYPIKIIKPIITYKVEYSE